MRKKILSIILFSLLFTHLSLTESGARRIREINPDKLPTALHELGTFIYDQISKGKLPERFTREEIMNLTGWASPKVHYVIKLLTEVGVLEVEEGKLIPRVGREPHLYRLKSPFDKRENLELLALIEELHRRGLDAEIREAIIPVVKGKIEIIKKAIQLAEEGSLKVELSPELKDFPEIRMKFFIGIVGQNLVELYSSFSNIKITKADSPDARWVNYYYDPTKDEITTELPGYPFEYVYKPPLELEKIFKSIFGKEERKPKEKPIKVDLMWEWLGSGSMHRELVNAVIKGYLKLEVAGTRARILFDESRLLSEFLITQINMNVSSSLTQLPKLKGYF